MTDYEALARSTVILGLCPRMFEAQLAEKLATGDLVGALVTVGRNNGPACLKGWRARGAIGDDALPGIVLAAWSAAEFPLRCVPRRTWLEWFTIAGFVSEPAGQEPPTEPVEVWRSQVGRTLGLAWTTSKETALWFHDRNVNYFRRNNARLLRGTVSPEGVLAMSDGRNESEIIAHPKRVRWTEDK